MKILLTGGLGFQGSHLADHWKREHDVTMLTTPSERALAVWNERFKTGDADGREEVGGTTRCVWGSVGDFEIVDKAARGQDVIVHLAAWSSVDESLNAPSRSFNINAGGTLNVLDAALRHGCRVIYASSCEVYGEQRDLADLQHEDSPCYPASPYAVGKYAGDRMAFAYAKSFDLDVTIVRPCNVFGPRQRCGATGAVIPTFVRAALNGGHITVRGDGDQSREWLYIDDLVNGYDLILKRERVSRMEVFNLGSGQIKSVGEIAHHLAETIGGHVVLVKPRVGDVQRFHLDSTHAREMLNWKPVVPFYFGIGKYVQWAERERIAGRSL